MVLAALMRHVQKRHTQYGHTTVILILVFALQ